MAIAVITVSSGGLPVVDVTATKPTLGMPVIEAVAVGGVKYGIPVTKVSNYGMAVSYVGGGGGTTGMAGTTFWVADGDSRTVGADTSPGTNYVTLAYTGGNLPWVVVNNNMSVNGATLTDVVNRAATADALKTSNPGYANYVISVLIGVNSAFADYAGNPSGFLTALANWADARRAAGWQVVIATELPGYSGANETTWESYRTTINTAVRGWVGSHCDAVADFAANPLMGDAGDQHNRTYYTVSDLHPTNAGHAVLAPIMENALLSIGSNTDTDPIVASQSIWDSSKKHANITLSNANRTAGNSTSGIFSVLSVNNHVTGRRHIEMQLSGASDHNVLGIAKPTLNSYTEFPGQTKGLGISWVGVQNAEAGVFTQVNAPSAVNLGSGNTFMMEVNFDTGKIWTGRNGTWDTNNPSLGTNPNFTFRPHARYYIAAGSVDSLNTWTLVASPAYMASGASPF